MFWDQSVKLMMTEQWQHLRRNLTDDTFINSWWVKRYVTFLSSKKQKNNMKFLIWLWSSGCSGKTKVVVQSQVPVACQSVPEPNPDAQSVSVCE